MNRASARKIPHLRTLLLLALHVVRSDTLAAQSHDSISTFRSAAKAEAEYEYAARRSAPIGASNRSGTCDEYVGRFCIYYDSGRDPLPAEPAEIRHARFRAIERLRTAFALNQARKATAFPFIRLLLEDKKPPEAAAVADSFSMVTSDVATAQMLLALTRHATADTRGAEAAIQVWLATVDSVERTRLTSPSMLLAPAERGRYRRLDAISRAAYDSVFWRYADPLYITDGNEVWTEHLARQAENQLLRVAPTVRGSTGWGRDVEELTIRYGTPKARLRIWPGTFGSSDPDISELWDPEQVSYAPSALDSALKVRARPGGGWSMDTVRSTSGHTPPTVRRMVAMEHQATAWRDASGKAWLRVDGLVLADSAARTASLEVAKAALFVLDDSLRILNQVTATTRAAGDTLFYSAEAPLSESAALYSAELLEAKSRLAGRARFRIDRPAPYGAIYLSDIGVTEPLTPNEPPGPRHSFRPRPTLLVDEGERFGIFAELTLATAPDSALVELAIRNLDGRPAALRAASWVGNQLGLTRRAPPTRMGWQIEVPSTNPTPIGVTLDPGGLRPGRYVIDLSVVTRSGARTEARREILIVGRD